MYLAQCGDRVLGGTPPGKVSLLTLGMKGSIRYLLSFEKPTWQELVGTTGELSSFVKKESIYLLHGSAHELRNEIVYKRKSSVALSGREVAAAGQRNLADTFFPESRRSLLQNGH